MYFDKVRGQDGPLSILKRALENGRIPTSYLFTGPDGCGRMPAAVATAAGLNCESGPLACGDCPSCRLYAAGNHPDLHLIAPARGKRQIMIQQVREDILEKAYLKPMIGSTSTFIIEDAHLMTNNAASAFLKTLEEPPETSHFILIAPHRESVLPTITSRCQVLPFRPLPKPVLVDLLVEQGVPLPAAELLSSMSEGSMERALSLNENGALAAGVGEFEQLLAIGNLGPGKILDISQAWSKNRQETVRTLELMIQWYRDLLVLAEGGKESLVISAAHLPALRETARKYPDYPFEAVLESIEDAREALDANANIQLTLDSLLLTIREKAASGEKRV
jgi:DNA polymerase-3 subunit delta'